MTQVVRLLVVDDDENILNAIIEYFNRARTLDGAPIEIMGAMDGETALKMLSEEGSFDVLITDLMLPKMDGLAICREVRRRRLSCAIMMLTSKDEETDRALGLEMGADDYITKPFSLRELAARIKSVLRRGRTGGSKEGAGAEDAPITCGKLRIAPTKREVTVGERQVKLTPKEFDLLRLLASNPGRAFHRKYLLEKIWGDSYEGYDRTIDSHINRLRAKIEDNPENPQMILTILGIGYRFSDVE